MKLSYFSNYFIICLPSFFSIIKVIIEFMFTHNFCSCYIDKSNFVCVFVHRNILMYNTNLHTIYLCRYASKNYTCSLFSI